MKYYFKEFEVTTKEEWKAAFCASYKSSGDDKHWKEGRSGECLAEDFIGTGGNGEQSIIDLINRILSPKSISLETAQIEYPSVFDNHPRPRIQDLAMWGRADNESIFVGVEAKVDEPFGSKTVAQQRKYVNGLTKTEANKRLDELVNNYLGGDEEAHGKLRYQLLYYLAGSFCEKKANIIFMPVIVYKSRGKYFNEYSDRKGEANEKAYKKFMKALGFTPMKDVEGGEINMAFHKRILAHGLEKDIYSCYIVK